MDGRMNRMLYRGTFYRGGTCTSTVSGSDSGGGVGGDGGCEFGMMKRAMGKGGGREEG